MRYLFLLTLLLPLTATASDTLRYVGSSTIGQFMADAAARYNAANLQLDTRGESAAGERCPLLGSCDIGGVARELHPELGKRPLRKTLLGFDAIAVVVHPSNPITTLSSNQLRAIFTGRIKNWAELGGPNMAVEPYITEPASATRQVFRQTVLGFDDYAAVQAVAPDARIVTLVARNPGAIGQISFAFIHDTTHVQPVAVDGQIPSMRNRNYPIKRPLYLLTAQQPSRPAQDFIDWATGSEGQAIVRSRFVSVR